MALDKAKTQMIMTVVLVLILAGVTINTMNSIKKTRKKGSKPAASQAAQTAAPAAGTAVAAVSTQATTGTQPRIGGFAPPDDEIIESQLSKINTEAPIKDPFYPIGGKSGAKKGSLMLKGISWKTKGLSYALINEEIVKPGDTVRNNKILDIDKKQVRLETDGQEYILILED